MVRPEVACGQFGLALGRSILCRKAIDSLGRPSLEGAVGERWNRVQGRSCGEWTMLVLSRKKNESIVINNDITIVVVEIRGDKVRLGVEAPKEVPVHRREVYDAIKRKAQSTDTTPPTGAEV